MRREREYRDANAFVFFLFRSSSRAGSFVGLSSGDRDSSTD